MKPASLDIAVYKGAAFDLVMVCKDEDGVVVDLTGYTAYAEIRADEDGAVILNLAPTITDATGGEITIAKTAAQTASLTAGRYRWDLLLKDGSNKTTGPYIVGRALVEPVITQPA